MKTTGRRTWKRPDGGYMTIVPDDTDGTYLRSEGYIEEYVFTKSQLLEQRKQDFAAGQELDDDRDEIGFKFDTFEDYLKSLEESGE